MGFVIISDTKLSTADAFQALGRADKLEKACNSIPKSYFCRRNGLLNRTAFYMLCLNSNPYEYLVMTIAELDMTLKVSEEQDAPLDELCRMLARRNGDQDDEEDEQPDEAPAVAAAAAAAAAANADEVRPEHGLPNNIDALPHAYQPVAHANEPDQQQPAVQNDVAPRNNPIEIIDDIEIEVVFENEVEFIPQNEVDADNDID